MKNVMGGIRKAVHRFLSLVLIHLLLFLIRILFRPKITYSSEKAMQEALKEPQILVCNHVRGWDGAVIYSVLGHVKVTALTAKDKMEGNRLMGWFLSLLPTLAIDREHPSLSWLRESRKLLKNGQHIMIFPEGKCNFNQGMGPFKEGCVMLAAAAGVKMLPVFHNGAYYPIFGPRFRMIVGEPVTVQAPPEGMDTDIMKQETDALFDTMQSLERRLTGTV